MFTDLLFTLRYKMRRKVQVCLYSQQGTYAVRAENCTIIAQQESAPAAAGPCHSRRRGRAVFGILDICVQQALPAPLPISSPFPLWRSVAPTSKRQAPAFLCLKAFLWPLRPTWGAPVICRKCLGIRSFPPSSGAALIHDRQELVEEECNPLALWVGTR